MRCNEGSLKLSLHWTLTSQWNFGACILWLDWKHPIQKWRNNYQVYPIPIICLFVITKTYLYNLDPLKLLFYTVKLGFTGVYIVFLIPAQKHRLWVFVRTAWRGGSNEYPQSMFWAEIWKYQKFYLKTFIFWWWNFQYIWIGVFS